MVNFQVFKCVDIRKFLWESSEQILGEVYVHKFATEQIDTHEFQIHARHLELSYHCILRKAVFAGFDRSSVRLFCLQCLLKETDRGSSFGYLTVPIAWFSLVEGSRSHADLRVAKQRVRFVEQVH